MVIYFADRRMNTLGLATTELREGFTVSDDLKSEDIDTGVASFECIIHWTDETRELAKSCTAAGNYLLRSDDSENEFYTIVEVEEDTKDQTIFIYAEDAGMDLLNETVGPFAADEAHPIAWYVEKYATDTGFEIGLNEISNLSRKLEWTGEATSAERIASVATQFDNAEISYSFEIKGLTITHKYINIHKKRGKDAGVQLRLNREVDRIITTTSIADLATSLYVTGGIPEGEEDPITITGYDYDDGDFYVTANESRLNSRNALAVWSRYVWENEPNQLAGYTGNIVKQWSYDTTSVSELVQRAVTQLKKICEPAVNYQIDIQQLPENVGIGDYVDIIDEKGELFLQSRILQLETSVCNQKQTATLGEFLIKDSGISQTVRELAEQFEQLAKSRTYYTWIAYADDDKGTGISLDPTDKEYMGTATNRSTKDVDISDPSIFTWVKITGVGIEEINVYYGVSDSPEVVPTEWTTTPPEVLRNEYTWSYTEYIYTSGLVEVTTPHIIAYYDYLEVDELDARTANIETLLAGQEGVGTLQAIHLTASNVVIDEAVIVDAAIVSLTADKLTAGTIYTDYVKIANNEGQALWIDGATIQMKDSNKTVRVQIGMDASGDYDYYLCDEDGNIIWDARGLTEEGLLGNGAIIRDDAVADNAAIQGSKLDIQSVTSCINQYGGIEVDAAQVTIDGEQLTYRLTSIEEQIQGIEGVSSEGITEITPMFAVNKSKEDAPTSGWTEEQPTDTEDGEYVWLRYKCTYVDGHTEYSTPILFVDMSAVSVLQTELSVVQGQIEAKIWKDDISDAVFTVNEEISDLSDKLTVEVGSINSQYSEISQTIDGITADVADMTTTLTSVTDEVTGVTTDIISLNEQMASFKATVDGFSSTVQNIQSELTNVLGEAGEGITKLTPYFLASADEPDQSLGPSRTVSANFDIEPDTTKTYYIDISADGMVPASITSYSVGNGADAVSDPVLDGNRVVIELDSTYSYTDGTVAVQVTVRYYWDNWTIEYPTTTDDEKVWIRYLLTYEDTHTAWTSAYSLADDCARSQISGAYSTIEQTATEIRMEVTQLGNDLEDNFNSVIKQEADSILLEVSETYAKNSDLKDVASQIDVKADEILLTVSETYVTGKEVSSQIDAKADEVLITVSETYVTGDEVSSKIDVKADEVLTTVSKTYTTQGETKELSSKIDSLPDSILLTVEENYATKASLVLEIDSNGDGVMTGNADTIRLTASKELIIASDSSDTGNIVMSGGVITANSTWGASATFSSADLQFCYNGERYGDLGMLPHNLVAGGIYTYTPCLYSYKDGVTLGVYETRSDVAAIWPALSVLQGDLYDYYGSNTYRIYFHEAAYAGNFTAQRLNVTTLYVDSVSSNSSSSWYKKADTVTRYLTGITPSSFSGPPDGYRPMQETWFPVIVSTGSGFCFGGIHLYPTSSTYYIWYYPSYNGQITEITNNSSYLIYGTLTYLTN